MRLFLSLSLPAAVALLVGACEKQSYSETRAFTHHGEHAPAADAKAGSQTNGAKDQKPAH